GRVWLIAYECDRALETPPAQHLHGLRGSLSGTVDDHPITQRIQRAQLKHTYSQSTGWPLMSAVDGAIQFVNRPGSTTNPIKDCKNEGSSEVGSHSETRARHSAS